MTLHGAAFALAAIVYPVVLLFLVDTYGLNGALLVSGALSLNALGGSLIIARPAWMSPDDAIAPIHRPSHAAPAAVSEGSTAVGSGAKGAEDDGAYKPETSKMSAAGGDLSSAASAGNLGTASAAVSGVGGEGPVADEPEQLGPKDEQQSHEEQKVTKKVTKKRPSHRQEPAQPTSRRTPWTRLRRRRCCPDQFRTTQWEWS